MSTKAMKEYRENELKWLNTINKLDAGTVKKDVKMKKLVRGGIPASVRAKVWQFLAGSDDYKRSNQFQNLLSKPRIPIYDVIERDIERCYPDHTQFMEKDGLGQQNLRNILKAYAQYNSDLEYCQGMGRLAGLMLMQMTVEVIEKEKKQESRVNGLTIFVLKKRTHFGYWWLPLIGT